jgi:hypothetical protein
MKTTTGIVIIVLLLCLTFFGYTYFFTLASNIELSSPAEMRPSKTRFIIAGAFHNDTLKSRFQWAIKISPIGWVNLGYARRGYFFQMNNSSEHLYIRSLWIITTDVVLESGSSYTVLLWSGGDRVEKTKKWP